MTSLLYITDQQEYADHGTIVPLFGRYLREHLHVCIVYHTRYKDEFQRKGDDAVVPEAAMPRVIRYLAEEGFDPGRFDIVLVRNNYEVLRSVLSQRGRFGYKVGFRLSFPKDETAHAAMMERYQGAFIPRMKLHWKRRRERGIIEHCDLFLPSSALMAEAHFPQLDTPTMPLPAGIDPERTQPPKPAFASPRRFIYVGALDPLRRFDVILDAFDDLLEREWRLDISTFNPTYLNTLLQRYPELRTRITVVQAADPVELGEQIRACDVGLALMPPLPIFATTLPAKVMDYYAAGVPVLLGDTPKNRDRLADGDEAFICAFDRAAIAAQLRRTLDMDDATLGAIRENGLRRLIGAGRGYDKMAKQLARRIETL